MIFKKSSIFIIVIIAIGLIIGGCTSQVEDESNKDGIAATVNGVDITMENFENIANSLVLSYKHDGVTFEGIEGKKLLKQLRQKALEALIQEELLLQEAEKEGYKVSEEEIDEEIEAIKRQYSSEEEFDANMKENNLTDADVREMVAKNMKIQQFIKNANKSVTVSEEEIQEKYNEYKERYEENEDKREGTPLDYEDKKSELEIQILQQKEQANFEQIIKELMENSEIEINIK